MNDTDIMELFRRRMGREPSQEELARLHEGRLRGRDPRRIIAGFMAVDYHRRRMGPEAMSQIRSRRGSRRGAARGDATVLRRKLHEAVDALVDYFEQNERLRQRGRRGWPDAPESRD